MPKKILISIVDDNQCFREALEALMVSMGYNVALFDCAEDYLVSGFVAQTSCLISDWQMPGMSGADLQDRLVAEGHRSYLRDRGLHRNGADPHVECRSGECVTQAVRRKRFDRVSQ